MMLTGALLVVVVVVLLMVAGRRVEIMAVCLQRRHCCILIGYVKKKSGIFFEVGSMYLGETVMHHEMRILP